MTREINPEIEQKLFFNSDVLHNAKTAVRWEPPEASIGKRVAEGARKHGREMALAAFVTTGTVLGTGCRPEGSPAPSPITTPAPERTPTPVRPTPTIEVKTPTPEATPTPLNPYVGGRGGGEGGVPTVEDLRLLSGGLELAKQKLPQGVKSEIASGISSPDFKTGQKEYRFSVVVEGQDGKRTLWQSGLDGNWQNTNLEIVYFPETDISKFKVDFANGLLVSQEGQVYFNSVFPVDEGGKMPLVKVEKLPQVLKENKKVFDLVRLRLDYFKDKEMLDPLGSWDVISGKWIGGEPAVPAETRSSLILTDLTADGIRKLDLDNIGDPKKRFKPFSATEVYGNNLELNELYGKFFDSKWTHSSWPNTDFRGLGLYYLSEVKGAMHTAVGLFYGVIPLEAPESIKQRIVGMGVEARPYWLILQIRPGKDITPQSSPESFVAIGVGYNAYPHKGFIGTTLGVDFLKGSELQVKTVTRTVPNGSNRMVLDAWTISELEEAFGLRRGAPMFVHGKPTSGLAAAESIGIFLSEPPTSETQKKFKFSL